MARLQHLTCLHVDETQLDWPPAGPAYTALTASTNLVEFSLCDAQLPHDIWRHVLCLNRKLPHLATLNIFNHVHGDELSMGSAWDEIGLFSLGYRCTNLCTISAISVQHGTHVSELQRLTSLTKMHVIIGPVGIWNCVKESISGLVDRSLSPLHTQRLSGISLILHDSLAALTQLKKLTGCLYGCAVSVGELLPLTKLTALTELEIVCRPGSGQRNDDGEGNAGHLLQHLEDMAISLAKHMVRHLVCTEAWHCKRLLLISGTVPAQLSTYSMRNIHDCRWACRTC